MARKELVRKYRETPRQAGVYRVMHLPSQRTLLGVSPDAQAMLNRTRAQLAMSTHPIRQLQRDWDTDSEDAFEFIVLDVLPPAKDPDEDASADLELLLELWTHKLEIEPSAMY
jgi:hypothetical protein